MTSLDQESLFSLELIVDQLCLRHSVECRIPAIAFRLLDFPTLLIYHVEPELADTIRSKLLEVCYEPLPAQLNELKDYNTGKFSVRRGKSCLFRVSPNTLVSNLCSAPLYVMVVDMFPETPKLVGSCGVLLNACAHSLYKDIVTNGISVPAVQAEKKELDLCNLTGKKVGSILLGYRLLSLGAALLSHIPTHNIIHLKPKEEIDHSVYPTDVAVPQSVTKASTVAQQSATAERWSENAEFDKVIEKTFTDSQTQIEPRSVGCVGTQTSRHRSHTNKPRTPLVSDIDDMITANIVCPPPLFYNSTLCKKTLCWHQEECSSMWHMANDDSSWSDDDTIRVEDKYIDADKEADSAMNLSSRIVKDKHPSPLGQSRNVMRSDPAVKLPYYSDDMTGFPVLSALMAEILRFQGKTLVQDTSGVDADHEARYRIRKMKKGTQLPNADSVKAVEPKTSAHECASMLPCDRGRTLLKRKSSGHPVHRKPFFAGMTNTQRLRLARVNPKLLQELETKELQRKNEFKAARVNYSKRQKENVLTGSDINAKAVDALTHIDISRATEYTDESRESTVRYKCPIPTPRTSKMLTADRRLSDMNVPDNDLSGFGTKTYTASYRGMESRHPLQSSCEENVQLALPLVEDDSANEYSIHREKSAVTNTTADLNRQVAKNCKQDYTPGCDESNSHTGPVKTAWQAQSEATSVALRDVCAGNAQSEATDVGGLLSVEDLGLRKIVDHYSDDSGDGDNGDVDDDDDGGDDDRREVGVEDEESQDKDDECDSVKEYKEKFDHKEFKDSEKDAKPELLHKVVNQYSVASEDETDDLEYDYDFEDTPVRSLKTVSTMNSSASSIGNSAVHRRKMSSVEGQETYNNVKMFGSSQPVNRIGEQHTRKHIMLSTLGGVGLYRG